MYNIDIIIIIYFVKLLIGWQKANVTWTRQSELYKKLFFFIIKNTYTYVFAVRHYKSFI